MGFLVINGVTIDVEYGTWKEEPVDVGELSARSLAARPARARGTKVRKWTFRTTPTEMSAAEMEKLALWIEGEGQSWKFDNTLFSGNGVQKTASGTVTAAATGGKFGGKATVASGSVFGVKMSNKLGKVGGWLADVHGWSLLCRRKFVAGETAGVGWRDLLLKGAVNFTRNSAANPTGVTQYVDGVVDASANLGRCFSVGASDPYVGPHGYLTDNTAADVDVDDLSFYPFEIPTSWIAGIVSWRNLYSWSALPRVKAWGDVFEDGLDVAPVEVIGAVTSKDVTQVCEDGVVKNTLRSLTVMLEEWATHTTAVEEPTLEPISADMTLWLDAADDDVFTLTGSTVNEWADKSPSAHHMDDDVAGWSAYPTREAAVQNGLPAVFFGSGGAKALEGPVGQQMGATITTSSGVGTLYWVIKPTSIAGNGPLPQDNDFVGGHSNGSYQLALRHTGFRAEFWRYDGGGSFLDDTVLADLVAETDAVLVVTRYDGAEIHISVNGGAEVTVAATAAASLTFPLILGRNAQTGAYFRGYICEILGYDVSHSADKIAENLAYVRAKWGTP